MSLEELNRMLKKIRSLVSSCDKKIFNWLEGTSTKRSKPVPTGLDVGETRTNNLGRFYSNNISENKILDPWD